VRLYVTVRVTTCLTLTALGVVALLGSKPRSCQSLGEDAQKLEVALRGVAVYGLAEYGIAENGFALNGVVVRGESLIESVLSDCGIRNRRRAGGFFGDFTLHGEGGGSETDGDFKDGADGNAGLVAVEG
jgi:hypothetical protein